MSEESGGERGLLTDISIFVLIIGLGLAAIYFTGNWPWFLEIMANLQEGIMDFLATFTENISSVQESSGAIAEGISAL